MPSLRWRCKSAISRGTQRHCQGQHWQHQLNQRCNPVWHEPPWEWWWPIEASVYEAVRDRTIGELASLAHFSRRRATNFWKRSRQQKQRVQLSTTWPGMHRQHVSMLMASHALAHCAADVCMWSAEEEGTQNVDSCVRVAVSILTLPTRFQMLSFFLRGCGRLCLCCIAAQVLCPTRTSRTA